jgi:hypothetical protein
MWDTFASATAIFLSHLIISIAVLENVLLEARLQKRATFSTLNVGLAGTGNRTRSTCVASSGTNRSAIHYDHTATNAREKLQKLTLQNIKEKINSNLNLIAVAQCLRRRRRSLGCCRRGYDR